MIMIIMKIFIISIIIAFITIHVCSSVIVVIHLNIVVYFYSFSVLTHSSWAFSWCPFAGVLPSFEYNFNSLLLTLITGVCSEISCSSISCFVETMSLTFTVIQLTGCYVMWNLGVGNLGTDYTRFYIYTCIYFFFFRLPFTLLSCNYFLSIF